LRIIRTHRLGKDVFEASNFENRANAATSDETGTRSSWAKHDHATVTTSNDVVRDSVTAKIDRSESTVCALSALANRIGNFLGLTVANTNATLTITRNNERSKVEAAATLYDFSATVNVNDFIVIFRDRTIITTWRAWAAATRATA
jgi:hypothetical protein